MNNLFTFKNLEQSYDNYYRVHSNKIANYIIHYAANDDNRLLKMATMINKSKTFHSLESRIYYELLGLAQSKLVKKYGVDKTVKMIKEYDPLYWEQFLKTENERRKRRTD